MRALLPRLLCLAVTGLFVLPGCGSSTPEPGEPKGPLFTDAVTPQSLGSMKVLSTFDGILLGGQPGPGDIELLKASGVTTVVNMRSDPEMERIESEQGFAEQSAVEQSGIAYVHLPVRKPEEFDKPLFDSYRKVFNETPRPFLLHCGSANRVGAVWLAWRVTDGGLTFEEALAEAQSVGLRSPALMEAAKGYIESQRQ